MTTWGVYDISGCVIAYGAELRGVIFECAETFAECAELCFGPFFGPAQGRDGLLFVLLGDVLQGFTIGDGCLDVMYVFDVA